AGLRSAVLDPRRGNRRKLISLHRDLHQGASPSTERRLRSELEARASPHRHSLSCNVWIRRTSSGYSAAMLRAFWTARAALRAAPLRLMERCSGGVSTISETA